MTLSLWLCGLCSLCFATTAPEKPTAPWAAPEGRPRGPEQLPAPRFGPVMFPPEESEPPGVQCAALAFPAGSVLILKSEMSFYFEMHYSFSSERSGSK